MAVQALAEGIGQGVVVITPSLAVLLGCRPPLGPFADNVVRAQSMKKKKVMRGIRRVSDQGSAV